MRLTSRLPLAALALAAALPAAAETRIGIIDFNRAVAENDEGKGAVAVLKKDLEEKQKTISARQQELQKLDADIQKQAAVLTDAARREKEADFEKKREEFQRSAMAMQQELSEARGKALDPIAERVNGIIREVAEAESLQLVIDAAAGVRFADNSLDITPQVIRRYNSKYPAGGAAPKKGETKPAAGAPAAKPATPATPAKK